MRPLVIASILLVATSAAAQSSDAPAAPPPPPAAQARPMSQQPSQGQSYGAKRAAPKRGTAPHKHGKRARGATSPSGAPIVSAPTFHRLDDGSTRISIEVAAKVDVGTNHPQGRLVFRLKNAFVMERVNLLPVITTYFATPVDRAQLSQMGPDVDLVIDLRESTTPTHRVVETPRGMVLQVDFPRVTRDDNGTGAPAVDSSRDRAKRRATTQTLGNDPAPRNGDH